MKLSIIVAASENNCIGVNNTLPWRQSADLAHFKALTVGHPIIMGRKTYDSIGKPLPNRLTIVVTRQRGWQCGHDDVVVVHSLQGALQAAKEACAKLNKNQALMVGGADLYRQALPLAQTIYLTKIHTQVEGDAYFASIENSDWVVASQVKHLADDRNQYDYTFVELSRAS